MKLANQVSGRVFQGWLLNCLNSALGMEELCACEPQITMRTECSGGGFMPLFKPGQSFPLSLIACETGYPKLWGHLQTGKPAVDCVACNHVFSRHFCVCVCMGCSS